VGPVSRRLSEIVQVVRPGRSGGLADFVPIARSVFVYPSDLTADGWFEYFFVGDGCLAIAAIEKYSPSATAAATSPSPVIGCVINATVVRW